MKRIDDLESLIKTVKDYITEIITVDIPAGGTEDMMRINFYIRAKNEQKGDILLSDIADNSRFVYAERVRDFTGFKEFIEISGNEDIEYDSNYNTVAKLYALSVSSIIQDDYSNDIFFKSIRMGEVLKDLMVEFFKDNGAAGFMAGELSTGNTADRVSIKGSKALRSSILYRAVIQ